MIKSQKEKILLTFGISFVFYLFSHGYRSMHNTFSGDALVQVYQNDYAWQIALGRTFNPIWVFIRGSLVSPFAISFLASLWISFSIYLISELFDLEQIISISLLATVMNCNIVITTLNASFIPWLDLQTFALLLNVIGIYLMIKKKRAFFIGVGAIALGLGTYQAYIGVAISLLAIWFLLKMVSGESVTDSLKVLLRIVVGIFLGGLIYYFSWTIIRNTLGIWVADTYNGLAEIGDFSDTNIISLVVGAYKSFFSFFWNPSEFVSIYYKGKSFSFLWVFLIRLINIGLTLLSCIVVYSVVKKNKTKIINIFFILLTLIMFPLFCNIIYVISKGMEHELMIYPFLSVYYLEICLLVEPKTKAWKETWLKYTVCVGLLIIYWSNSIFSNQIYLRKVQEETAAISFMSRMVYDIEHFSGYKVGETRIDIVGTFTKCPSFSIPDGTKDLELYHLSNSPFLYGGTEQNYLKYYLNSGIEMKYANPIPKETMSMSIYPEDGSMKMIDDVLVIKISD